MGELTTRADPLYQHLIVTAERKFWRCVQNGDAPHLFEVDPPRPRLEAVRTVDMSASNTWAELAAIFPRTRPAHLEHEAQRPPSKLVPEDAQQADWPWHCGRNDRNPAPSASTSSTMRERPCSGLAKRSARSQALLPRRRPTQQPREVAVATIRTDGPGGGVERSFRYAPLSSGLEIVRKTLSQHEIATVQTTAIDPAARSRQSDDGVGAFVRGMDCLDWPVCGVEETATPHRMGAALTSDQRYALFTLVGIAGEDDMHAPDLGAPTRTSPSGPDRYGPRKNGGFQTGQDQLSRRQFDATASRPGR